MSQVFALITAAVAVLLVPVAPTRHRLGLRRSPPVAPRPRREERADPLVLAAGWDLLAAGMRAGLPVPVIVRAVAVEVVGTARRTLNEVADHLALGSDAAAGWEPALRDPDTAELARAARRTARTGSALADVAAELADRARARSSELAEVRAQRGAVWISAPLGLCFLPAFLCLGVLPVVLGMFDRIPINPL
ncbi:type II secretion system F family protein [Saccharopolyspora endophytica]|uniref:Type II secretion system F family protein n=1 Tax=Saccharopolyspora endophytica TaxID=543886 RepID=A0ABS5DP58_9PSEU|nr:type II secretion system F family protein [Saccharopolyspora endophytica]MBQ0928079.1 type II secretion system F family protein [Saccharopolyspora endophytica]